MQADATNSEMVAQGLQSELSTEEGFNVSLPEEPPTHLKLPIPAPRPAFTYLHHGVYSVKSVGHPTYYDDYITEAVACQSESKLCAFKISMAGSRRSS